MNFSVFDTQHKSRMLALALLERGHHHVPADQADLLLIDIDDPDAPLRSETITATKANGGAVFLYPHGATPAGTYHGYYQPDPRVDAQLVHGPGFLPVLENAGLRRTTFVTGWSYSPRLPFVSPRRIRRILFGPLHPYGTGQILPEHQALNRRVFDTVCRLPNVEVAVQLYGSPTINGLPPASPVRWVASTLRLDWSAIDTADLVVAEGTLAMLAMARGKPVVTFTGSLFDDENDRPAGNGPCCDAPAYPLDVSQGLFPDLVEVACAGSTAADEWAADFVGGPLDEEGFCRFAETAVAHRRELLMMNG